MFDRAADFLDRHPLRPPDVVVTDDTAADVDIRRDTLILGEASGDVRVRTGAQVRIDGEIAGDLHVERDAVAYVGGSVNGDALIEGAAFVIGTVGGNLTARNGADVEIAAQAR